MTVSIRDVYFGVIFAFDEYMLGGLVWRSLFIRVVQLDTRSWHFYNRSNLSTLTGKTERKKASK